ncbi:hypothetical protein Hdeb2414_s0002g00062741 [Helianthus debilis subsp. tardiflorus]
MVEMVGFVVHKVGFSGCRPHRHLRLPPHRHRHLRLPPLLSSQAVAPCPRPSSPVFMVHKVGFSL